MTIVGTVLKADLSKHQSRASLVSFDRFVFSILSVFQLGSLKLILKKTLGITIKSRRNLKTVFHSENASNVFHIHYTEGI